MAVPLSTVEIGFDIIPADANFFTLDSATKGRLDNSTYRLSGTIFYDVTDKVKSISVSRGKNRQLDEFDGGLANVVFDNNDRTFDPEYVNSPYYGQIIPKRAIRILSGGYPVFHGAIDDWNLLYNPGGFSEAAAASSDAFTLFNTQTLTGGTGIAQKSGERINAILNSADVDWATQEREVETGLTDLGTDVYEDGTNVLDYLRSVARSEPGNLFIGKDGKVVYTDRAASSNDNAVVLADDGTGIPYQGMKVVYGSELLYNEIVLGSVSAGTVIARDENSIAQYGVLNLTQTGLLMSSPTYLEQLAVYYATKYSQPEYRFESVEIVLDELSVSDQEAILGLEISDFVTIKFTPNGIAPAIEKVAEIIRIGHSIVFESHVISFGFATVDNGFWTLSDRIFGRLSTGNVLGF
jgi:hypothetical protein